MNNAAVYVSGDLGGLILPGLIMPAAVLIVVLLSVATAILISSRGGNSGDGPHSGQ